MKRRQAGRQAAEHLASRKTALWRGGLGPGSRERRGGFHPAGAWGCGEISHVPPPPVAVPPGPARGTPAPSSALCGAVCGTGAWGQEPLLHVEGGKRGRDTDVKSKRQCSG